eukprot:364408-Chlamydomonas_euryale.AAC.3
MPFSGLRGESLQSGAEGPSNGNGNDNGGGGGSSGAIGVPGVARVSMARSSLAEDDAMLYETPNGSLTTAALPTTRVGEYSLRAWQCGRGDDGKPAAARRHAAHAMGHAAGLHLHMHMHMWWYTMPMGACGRFLA